MTDQIRSIHDDLAYMRALADDDGRMPAAVGGLFLAAGLIYGLPTFAAWASLRGLLPGPNGWVGWTGIIPTVVFLPLLIFMIRRSNRGWIPGPSGRAFAALWTSVGLTLVTLGIATWLAGQRLNVPQLWQLWPSILFGVYGSAWMGVALVRRSVGWSMVGLGCYATAVGSGFLIGSIDLLLCLAVGLLAWLAGPGLVMMSAARRS
jgi:hypothetical protein